MFKKIIITLKEIYLKILLKIASNEKRSEIFRRYYGVKIGKNAVYTGIPNWGSEPYLIELGNDVRITTKVRFYTHDGGVGIFRKEYPGLNVFGKIKIGNNVFIGSHSTFLPGVTVGSNVVIATSSVITKDIPDNVVVAGIPAKVIKSLDEYLKSSLKNGVIINEEDEVKRKQIILESVNKQ